MDTRSAMAVLLAAGVALGTAVAASATPGPAGTPRGERTRPRVNPSSGTPSTVVGLVFRLRETPGHQGVMATDYRVQVSPPSGSPKSCWPTQPQPITSGQKGHLARIALHPPSGGWCRGAYRATVFLERGPYCPPPQRGQPQPCPEFATQELDTGHARFTVR
jgi:hypothetical protein